MATQEVGRLPVIDEVGQLVWVLSIEDVVFRARSGRSCFNESEVINRTRPMREERIHQLNVVTQNNSDLRSNIRMPMNYEDMNIRK